MKRKDLIGSEVIHSSFGPGIIYEFVDEPTGMSVVIKFRNKSLKEPYPECLFEGSDYVLLKEELRKSIIAQYYQKWQNFRTALSVLKNVRICCDRCHEQFHLTEYEKWKMNRDWQARYCGKCESIFKYAERRKQMKKKPSYSFEFVASLMWHSMPISSKKTRIHETDGMNIGW